MNKIFKVIFNRQTGTFQAVQETAKGQHKTQSSQGNKTKTAKIVKAVLRPLTIAMTLLASSIAIASPTGGQVTAGQATINQAGNITNINQSSQNAAINWQSFNIAKNETVNFNQPNTQSVTLNRVIGNERSVIDGAMNANGKVFISNANGMLIGKDAKINVGSLVATTANISDDDLMNGRYQFTGEGAGSIENLGQISVPKGGVVALVAPIVKNGGTITAPQANALLASAESFSITLPDNANFAYTLDKGTLQGLVDNGGAILADGGRVVLTAKGVDVVKKSLIKHTGAIQANTVQNKNGVIELLGDLDNSDLTVSGSLKAEAKESGDGGFIETSASQVKIEDSAEVSTLAQNGKTGTWLISSNKSLTISDNNQHISSTAISNSLNKSNVELKTNSPYWKSWRNQEKNTPANIIVDKQIDWSNNILKLNSSDSIYINENLNGKKNAKLWLQYMTNARQTTHYYGGKCTSCFVEGEADYHIKQGKSISLDEGFNLAVNKGDGSAYHGHDFKNEDYFKIYVIKELPEIETDENGDYVSKFEDGKTDVALGRDIDLSYLANKKGFQGWENIHNFHGLGHKITNLSLDVKKSQNDYYGVDVGLFKTIPITRDLEIENGNVQVVNSGSSPIYAGLLGGKSSYSHIYNVKLSGKVTAESKPNNDKSSSGVYVGGIAGQIGSTDIENVHVDADLTGISNNYGASVGGLGGAIGSPLYYSSGYHTANSSFTGNINSHSKFVDFGDNTPANASTIAGGVFGENSFQQVKQSYTKAKINATSNTGSAYAGGINGYTLHGWLENVYSESEINAHSSLAKKPDYDIENIAYVGGLNGLLSTDQNYSHYFNNVYASGKLSATSDYKTFMGGLAGRWLWSGVDDPEQDKNRLVNIYSQDRNITSFFNKDLAGTSRTIGQDSEERYSDSVKNTNELKDPATFKDWDFDNIWYMNEGSMPKLRAFATPLAVTPSTPTLNAPTDKAQAGIKAPDLSKTYDGKAVNTVDDLKKLNGWKDNFDADGLTTGDSVESIFKAGTLTIDETKGDWKGAKDVKDGGYELYPTGTLKDEYQQKYIIEWNKGTLTINPAKLTITAMNNIKPEGDNNPDVSRIGVVVQGLVEGESISDVNLSYSDDKKWQGDISIIRVGEPVFKNGKASNYEITKNHGKLLTVQKEYDLNNITNKKPEDVAKIRDLLNAFEDEILVADAIYKNDEGSLSEVWLVIDKQTNNVVDKILYPENKTPPSNDFFKYEKYINIADKVDRKKGDFANGLGVALYEKKLSENSYEYFLVFRGTDTKTTLGVINPFDSEGDGGSNIGQGIGLRPEQYLEASEIARNLLKDNPNIKITFVGHSLGGGLATYASSQLDGSVKTVAIDPAALNMLNIKNKLSRYPNIHNIIFDYEVNQATNSLLSTYIGHKHKVGLLSTGSPFDDHSVKHAIKTQRLSDIMAKNNEISANCQKDCVKLQEHQWTPAPKLAETKKSAGDTIRYNNEVGNAIRQTLGDKADEIVGNVGLLDPTKPIAVVTNSDTIFTTNGKIVSVERGEGLGKQIFALKEWNVENGDIIRTADKKVTIQFSDGSWVELAPYTMVRIDFSHKKDGDDDLIANYLVLHKGQGQILTKGTKKPE